MIEIIIISLAITALVIVDDLIFNATLKMTHPLTSAKLHATAYDNMDFEDYCNWRMNRKAVKAIAPATAHRTSIKFFQE